MTQLEKFISYIKFDANDQGCWFWMGARNKNGYGRCSANSQKNKYAHRVSYASFVCKIPLGYEVDHICKIRYCVNPDHLEIVDRTENVRRQYGWVKGNDGVYTCKRGHRLTEDNLLRSKDRSNGRCWECVLEYRSP